MEKNNNEESEEQEYFLSYCKQCKKPTRHMVCGKGEKYELCCICGYRKGLEEKE